MGQNNFKSNDNRVTLPINWQQSTANSNIFINRLTQQHLQKHLITILIKDLPKQTTLLSARIANNHPYVVRLYHYHPVSNQTQTRTYQQTDTRDLQVYTDHVLPLSKEDWTHQKIIHIIQALKRLVIIYGPFCITEQMIAQNQLADVRVWINNHPGLNHPTYTCDNQEQTLNSLINILVHKNQDSTHKLRGCRTLRQALERLQDQQKTISVPYQRLSYQNEGMYTLTSKHIGTFQTPPINPSNRILQINRVSSLKTYQKQFLNIIDHHEPKLIKSYSNSNNFHDFKSQCNNFPTSKTLKRQKSHHLHYQFTIDHRDSLKFSQKTCLTENKQKDIRHGQQQKIKNKAFKINPFIYPNSKESSQISHHHDQPADNHFILPSSNMTPTTNAPCRLSYKQLCNNQNPSSLGHSTYNYVTSPKALQAQAQTNIHLQKSYKIQHCTTPKNKYLNLTEGNNNIKNQNHKVPIFIKNMKKKTSLEDQQYFGTLQNKSININNINNNQFTNLQIKPKQEDAREEMNKSTKQSFISGQPYRSRPDSHPKKHIETLYNLNPLNSIKHRDSLSKPINKSKSPFRQKSDNSNTSSRPNISTTKHILAHVPSISYFKGINKSQFKKQKQKTLNRTKTSEWSNKTKIAGHFDTITFRTQLETTHRKNMPQSNKQIHQQIPNRLSLQINKPLKQTQNQQKHSLKKQLKLQFQSLLGQQEKTLINQLNNKQTQINNEQTDELKYKIKMKQLAFAQLKKQALMVLTDD